MPRECTGHSKHLFHQHKRRLYTWQVKKQVIGKFGLGVRNEAGPRLIEFCQENALVIANTFFKQHNRRLYTWTSPEIRLVIFFAAKDGEALYSQQKSPKSSLGCNLTNDRMISVCFQSKPFNITIIQVYAPTSNAEEAEVEQFYEDLQDLLELTPKKMSFSL